MKKSHIIGIVLIAVAIAAIFSTMTESSTYADFQEAINQQGKEFHVVGKLNKEKAFEFNPMKNANLFSFYMMDNKGKEMQVNFNGTKPEDFEKSEQIVVIGKVNENGYFVCSKILMKCPSKYENPEDAAFEEYPAKTNT